MEELKAAPFTYPEVGRSAATYPSGFPDGYHLVRHREVIGQGREHFAVAGERLLHWQMHARSGLQVAASSERVGVGEVVLLRLGAGRLSLRIPCRVIYMVQEPDRVGFGYGTLPGHPESGEESFLVELEASGAVVFTVAAFSRPGTLLARLGGPLSRQVQGIALRRYAAALKP